MARDPDPSGRPPQKPRRREFRYRASATVVHGNALEGRLLNVARSGLGIECESPVRVRGEYRLRVEAESSSFEGTGIVRWCALRTTRRNERGEFAPVYHAGLSIVEDQVSAWEEVLERVRRPLVDMPPH